MMSRTEDTAQQVPAGAAAVISEEVHLSQFAEYDEEYSENNDFKLEKAIAEKYYNGVEMDESLRDHFDKYLMEGGRYDFDESGTGAMVFFDMDSPGAGHIAYRLECTADYGKTWTDAGYEYSSYIPTDIRVKGNNIYIAMSSGGYMDSQIYYSDDLGKTFRVIEAGNLAPRYYRQLRRRTINISILGIDVSDGSLIIGWGEKEYEYSYWDLPDGVLESDKYKYFLIVRTDSSISSSTVLYVDEKYLEQTVEKFDGDDE